MDTAISISNLIILVLIFFYQKNKNKTLSDELKSQKDLLNETKTLVAQQTAAIDGQHKVVTTALDYSERFNPEKLEDLIRRELALDHTSELAKLKKSFEEQQGSNQTQNIETLQSVIKQVVEFSATRAVELLLNPLLPPMVSQIASLPDDKRDEFVSSFSEPLLTAFTKALELIRTKEAEQGGADQPATAPKSNSEGDKKPQSEPEGRSQ